MNMDEEKFVSTEVEENKNRLTEPEMTAPETTGAEATGAEAIGAEEPDRTRSVSENRETEEDEVFFDKEEAIRLLDEKQYAALRMLLREAEPADIAELQA